MVEDTPLRQKVKTVKGVVLTLKPLAKKRSSD
jgi:hypothetical protein